MNTKIEPTADGTAWNLYVNGTPALTYESYQVCCNVEEALRHPMQGGYYSEAAEVAEAIRLVKSLHDKCASCGRFIGRFGAYCNRCLPDPEIERGKMTESARISANVYVYQSSTSVTVHTRNSDFPIVLCIGCPPLDARIYLENNAVAIDLRDKLNEVLGAPSGQAEIDKLAGEA